MIYKVNVEKAKPIEQFWPLGDESGGQAKSAHDKLVDAYNKMQKVWGQQRAEKVKEEIESATSPVIKEHLRKKAIREMASENTNKNTAQ
jgi:hypothetical protein